MFVLLLVILGAAADAGSHHDQNPVYRELLDSGAKSGTETRKLPAPTLADGMSMAEQAEAIEALDEAPGSFERLTRKSVVAPQVIRVPSVDSSSGKAPLRTADVWFVVYADLDAVADREFLTKLLQERPTDGGSHELSTDELRARGVAPPVDDYEAYGHLTYDLLDKVRLSATVHSFWSRTDESIVAAVMLDPRFAADRDFPNHWQPLEGKGKAAEAGSPQPYEGLGFYAKITRLKRPVGALFVEYHAVFAEPTEWFHGTNQLGSKLPAVIQNQVREARRKMMQPAAPADAGR
jgi:hypothetical protein